MIEIAARIDDRHHNIFSSGGYIPCRRGVHVRARRAGGAVDPLPRVGKSPLPLEIGVAGRRLGVHDVVGFGEFHLGVIAELSQGLVQRSIRFKDDALDTAVADGLASDRTGNSKSSFDRWGLPFRLKWPRTT